LLEQSQTATEGSGKAETHKARVLLSYSRNDAPFMRRLAEALANRGYAPDFDQSTRDPANIDTGISAEDEWWPRLKEMIALADAMVFVVSPDSAASPVCDDEIAYARDIGKRIIPVVWREVDFSKLSQRLAALNIGKIDFRDESEAAFAAALDRLAAELDLHVDWHREATRLILLATRWDNGGRSDDLLLTDADVRAVGKLLKGRPAAAPELSAMMLALYAASRTKLDAEELRRRRIKPLVLATQLIGFFLCSLALVDLIAHGVTPTIADWLNNVLQQYRKYSELTWWFLDPLAKWTAEHLSEFLKLFGVEFSLNPWWKSFWTAQFFYIVACAASGRRQHRSRSYQIGYFSVGIPVFFASSVAASNWPLEGYSIWPMVFIGTGFAAFHLFGVFWYANFIANINARTAMFWWLMIVFPLANIAIVMLIATLAVFALKPNGIELPVVIQVLLAVALMGARDVAGGLYGATFFPRSGGWLRTFFSYGSTAQGLYVLAALVAAMFITVLAVQHATHDLK
jgi:hypothetical protein